MLFDLADKGVVGKESEGNDRSVYPEHHCSQYPVIYVSPTG